MNFKTNTKLSELIQSRIHLGTPNPNGWYPVIDPVCNDHSPRAAFKFDAGFTGWHCFNCGSKAKYEEGSGKLSRGFRRVLEAFGISNSEISELLGSTFFNKPDIPKDITIETLKPAVNLYTPEIPLPPNTFPIGADTHPEFQIPLAEYIMNRGLDAIEINAHFSLDPKYFNRVILPCYRDNKIIYWQARTITDKKPRYLSPGTNKDSVLWGYDKLHENYNLPLFIVEGIFDAASIDGIALIGSQLNEAKLQILNNCRRQKVVVVDRDDNGGRLGQLALEHGWQITFPPDGCDANKSLQKYGKLFTIRTLMKNMTTSSRLRTASGIPLQSELQLKMQLSLSKLNKK
jgi:hypothetical protein